MKALFRLLLASFLLLSASAAFGDDATIVVIVNDTVSARQISPADLRLLFQTNKLEWEGRRMTPLNLPRTDQARKTFDQVVLGMDEERVLRYWIDRKIRGGNPPPKQIPEVSLVVRLVAKMEGAIAYVPESALAPGVRVVAKIKSGKVTGP